MDSAEVAVSIYREEPDNVLALRGRLQLDRARKPHRTPIESALTGGNVEVDFSATEYLDGWVLQILSAPNLALEHGYGSAALGASSGAPGTRPRKWRKSARKHVV